MLGKFKSGRNIEVQQLGNDASPKRKVIQNKRSQTQNFEFLKNQMQLVEMTEKLLHRNQELELERVKLINQIKQEV